MDKVNYLLQVYGHNDQRTAEWYSKREKMLTASEIYKALSSATPCMRYELILSKLLPKNAVSGSGARALIWGTRFEPIAKSIFSELNGVVIEDLSCVPHPRISFLGASPDGIITSPHKRGTLVEFKCPISREFSDHSPIPDAYYCQMQLQMECTELTSCEYIEMQFKQLSYSEWMDAQAPYKSFYAVSQETGEVVYRSYNDTITPAEFREKILGDAKDSFTIVYWMLNNWRSKTVSLDPNWLTTHLPSIASVWQEIQEHKQKNTIPEHPREKVTLTL